MDESTVSIVDINQVFNLTTDAIASCAADGTIRRANRRFAELTTTEVSALVGQDIKDLLFTTSFERASHALPFSPGGEEASLMLKLPDGSFIPVHARATVVEREGERRVVVAFHSVQERYAHDRERRQLLEELSTANKRLSGTLSIILSSLGSANLTDLTSSVLNELTDTLDAKGATMYFAESGGFKLRGISSTLVGARVPGFVPYGAGVPTLVVREDRPMRFTLLPQPGFAPDPQARSAVFLDLDVRDRHRFRLQDTPPFHTFASVPLHFGTRVLGIIEAGWDRPYTPRDTDVQVLEAVCEYLSIELMNLITSMRSQRRNDLARSLSRVRDVLFSDSVDYERATALISGEIVANLGCRIKEVERDPRTGEDYLDFGTFGKLLLPRDITSLFFSATAPAVRMGDGRDAFISEVDAGSGSFDGFAGDVEDRLETVRLARIDRMSPVGDWLVTHGLPASGVFIDLGIDDERRRGFLLMRLADQEPFDDMEYDYLAHMIHDYEVSRKGLIAKREEHRIAQALQRGMESRLQEVPGITSDALYSSATEQALVGGDFFELIRLPDDRAVMILGDVSGKGVEVASMSALVKTALAAYAWEGMSPARMVRALNGMLLSFSRVETFATMFVARIDLRSGRAVYCSAGHPPAMVYRAGCGEVELLSRQSGVVGAFQTMTYHEGRFAFGAGDMLFLYTDGAIEARDAAGDFFGEDRLRELVLTTAPQGVHGFCQRVLYELDRFTESTLNDDIALVMLRFDRSGEGSASGAGAAGDAAGTASRRIRGEKRAPAAAATAVSDSAGGRGRADTARRTVSAGHMEAAGTSEGSAAPEKPAEGRIGARKALEGSRGRLAGEKSAGTSRSAAGEKGAGGAASAGARGAEASRGAAGEQLAAQAPKKRAGSKKAAKKAVGGKTAGKRAHKAQGGAGASGIVHAPMDLGKRVLRHWMKNRS